MRRDEAPDVELELQASTILDFTLDIATRAAQIIHGADAAFATGEPIGNCSPT